MPEILTRLAGSAIVAAQLRLSRAPFWPRKKLEAARDRRIRRIVAYAAQHVPFYREFFNSENIDPRAIRNASDLDDLPLIDRERVRRDPHLFVAETEAGRSALSFLTSGSTGTPIEIRHDRRSLLANIAFGERERDPVNRACGGLFRPRELYVGYETSTFKNVIAFYDDAVLFPVRPKRRFVSLLEPIEQIAALMNRDCPDILVGYGGWIDLFFKTVAARGVGFHRPRMVLYMGEALPHGTKEFIEGQFGIPVLSRYNAVEAFKIGFYCDCRMGFHVHEDICHLRIVGTDGKTVPSGQPGQVVISNLLNRATVLLNYPLGDMAAMTSEPCACGRTFRRLSELEGRIEDILTLPDGRFVHPRAIWQVFKDERGVIQYQVEQMGPLRYVLRLVTNDDSSFKEAVARTLPEIGRLLGSEASVEVERRSVLERPAGGKFRAVLSLKPRKPKTEV